MSDEQHHGQQEDNGGYPEGHGHGPEHFTEGQEIGADEGTSNEDASTETTTRRAAPSTRSRTKVFSWADVEDVVNFTRQFDALPEQVRADVLSIFGYETESDAVDLAQGLYPAGGSLAAYWLFSETAQKIAGGTFGWDDGMTLTATVTDWHADTIRALVRIINHFGDEDISYRSGTTPITTVVSTLVNTLQEADKERLASLSVVDDLLSVWPGDR